MSEEGETKEGTFVLGDVTHNIAIESDGVFKIGELRYVKEDDLLANKTANETRIKELEDTHTEEISKLSGDGSSTRTLLLQAQAEVDRFKTQADLNATAASDLVKAKADLDAANTSRQTQADLALLYRKKHIAKEFGITDDKLDGKDMSQLGFFEEALQAVNISATGGVGNYAAGGGSGGNATPQTPMERATAALENASKNFNSK